ncbi:hypothetical protein [Halobacterium salinarum]|uniref:Uncharacterized protein n=1 Tax=Halobacterium salinarum TaxID=2242 RepID=A0A841HF18_HALSI|nr:hypothetical protein [Halobacterium salinarum]MBB6090852.1 hypothetical protein [Halobacterium salinarum]MDL0128500.1 hypothetical protein [Halobacterium salinarum]
MSVHYTHQQSYVPPINRPHAPEQWRKRTPAEIDIEAAWKLAIPVRAPECNAQDVRLYAPYDALLLVRGGLLRTALLSDHRTDLAGLFPCPSCDDLVDPIRSDCCPWCDAVLEDVARSSIRVTKGGGQR